LGNEHVGSVRRLMFLLGGIAFWGAYLCPIERFAGGNDPFQGFSPSWVVDIG
jgi:hypothetical protein